MGNIVTIGYAVEGSTDKRFLEAIIKKTFEDVAFACESMITVYDPILLKATQKIGFSEDVKEIADQAYKSGINILCIHTDADNHDDTNAFNNKINPAFNAVAQVENSICKNLVAIVPIHMTEAWMMADKELLKTEIGTNKSDNDLGINRRPEQIADPKSVIVSALNEAQIDLPKKRRKIQIGELYQPIGQKLSINSLQTLESYKKFWVAVENAFKQLNYLH